MLVIGGRVGSFLGEYLAGGRIIVLGLHRDGKQIVSNFPGTGILQNNIHPKWFICKGANQLYLFKNKLRVRKTGANHSETAAFTDGSRKMSFGNMRHTSLNNRIFDSKHIT